jgi:polar amino acid transport system permease protein
MTKEILETILRGLPMTLLLTGGGLAIGCVGGIPLMLARVSRFLVLRVLARAVIELFRGVPPIVWMFFIAFGLGSSLTIDTLTAAVIALGVISSAYMAEIYRGGLLAVHRGQFEASHALGMSRVDTMARVVGPQVVRVSVPAAATFGIGLLKDSSVASTIGVSEMTFLASQETRLSGDVFGPFLTVAAVYILLSLVAAWASRSLDSALRRRVAR